MTYQAIAEKSGVNRETVEKQFVGNQQTQPAAVIGKDGKIAHVSHDLNCVPPAVPILLSLPPVNLPAGAHYQAGELRLRVEARLGGLIKIEQEAGRLAWGGNHQGDNIVTLKSYGISKKESSRAQQVAK